MAILQVLLHWKVFKRKKEPPAVGNTPFWNEYERNYQEESDLSCL